MMIPSDEDSLRRMLGVEAESIPAAVIAEYELRLKMFHSDGHSGPIGSVAIIDMLRSMKLGPRPSNEQAQETDWLRLPIDGSVHVEAKVLSSDDNEYKWIPGVFVGRVGVGTLAVRLDGGVYVHEFGRRDVRIYREKPAEPVVNPIDDPWLEVAIDDQVVVEDGDDYKEGLFKGIKDGKIMVLLEGKERSRAYAPENVALMSDPQLAR